ncbi:MAG: hypothetical protein KDD10_30505 [Phaeodactylibacter sp.]|nr:hypothetical protein [Phaeodactylibacter sp.]
MKKIIMKLLNIFSGVQSALLLALVVGVFFAFKPKSDSAGEDVFDVETSTASSSYYAVTETDTITNTEIDTFLLDGQFRSKWDYNYSVHGDQLSGTIALNVILQETNDPDGTLHWYEVQRDTVNADEEVVWLSSGSVDGVRQRVIVDGDGTQSAKYYIRAVFKKTN